MQEREKIEKERKKENERMSERKSNWIGGDQVNLEKFGRWEIVFRIY